MQESNTKPDGTLLKWLHSLDSLILWFKLLKFHFVDSWSEATVWILTFSAQPNGSAIWLGSVLSGWVCLYLVFLFCFTHKTCPKFLHMTLGLNHLHENWWHKQLIIFFFVCLFPPNLIRSLWKVDSLGIWANASFSFLHWHSPFFTLGTWEVFIHIIGKNLGFWCQRVKASWVSLQWYTATILFLRVAFGPL